VSSLIVPERVHQGTDVPRSPLFTFQSKLMHSSDAEFVGKADRQ
jgi:hypothetical protein